MRILAVDPGFSYGWVLFRRLNGNWQLLGPGSGRGMTPEDVWGGLKRDTAWVYTENSRIKLFEADVLVVEQQPQKAVWAGVVANGLRALAWQRGILFAQIPSTKVKKLVTGNGRATKEEVKAAVEERFGVECENYHESDAIAVGLAYLIQKEGGNEKGC